MRNAGLPGAGQKEKRSVAWHAAGRETQPCAAPGRPSASASRSSASQPSEHASASEQTSKHTSDAIGFEDDDHIVD
jgi:hypothetical protein